MIRISFGMTVALGLALGTSALGVASAVASPVQPGFYIGLNAGGSFESWQRKSGIYDCCGDFTHDTTDETGFAGGAQGGWNWISNGWLFGVEGDFDGTTNYKQRIPGTGIIPHFDDTSEAAFRSPWLATVRGRVGFQIPTHSITLYATGGVAFSQVDYEINDHSGSFTDSKTMTGWTAGLGAEMPISNEVSVKVEYLYVDLGSKTFSPTGSTGTVSGYASDIRPTDSEVRLGFNWHF